MPTRLPAGYRLSVSRREAGGTAFGITAKSHLFEITHVALRTRAVALPGLVFRWTDGAPSLANIADEVSPSMLVSWRKSLFRSPDLPAGAVWRSLSERRPMGIRMRRLARPCDVHHEGPAA